MNIFTVNWLALVISIVWSMGLGMVWYSPKLFFPIWQKAEGITDEDMKNSNMGKTMIFGLTANSLSVYFFGILVNLTGIASWQGGLGLAALVSSGIITASEINNGTFRMTKPVVYLIDGGYRLLMLIPAGILFSIL
ncbi:DUF1761 domain-containing protein [Spirochaeta isovalerica]|uniref:DUF1761 domain-containing protein n=1 Tax=Spirochaeta isovalerica TaxID=150 RepID=A0A841REP0_9SPIO|nr:DUF1761 domain-containing protein [Spirochaeta isovalerica]MBB6481851.1 hypothetical protein [Spirochaeta isovalerica]